MPNIEIGTCRKDCAQTWACEHGAALPGGPFPGTHGTFGDVRRCEHGRIWYCTGRDPSRTFDFWERLTWWDTPVRYWRAVRRLNDDIVDAEIVCGAEHSVVPHSECGLPEGHRGAHETTVLRWSDA